MKKRKGSLIIATCLLSVVLLIILMTMFNINRKNTELISVQSDREKAYQAAKMGLDKATEDIEKRIDEEYIQKHINITWKDLYELASPTTVTGEQYVKEGDENYLYSYSYSYINGKIKSTGSYGTSKSKADSVKITLTANYIMDYMGISSSGLYYIPRDQPKDGKESNNRVNFVGLNAVYSQNSQCPMTPWINYNSIPTDNNLAIQTPKSAYCTYYNLSNIPISSYYLLYENKFGMSSMGEYTDNELSKNQLIINNNYSAIRSETSRNYIMEMVKSLNIAGQYAYDNAGGSNKTPHVFIADKNVDKSDKSPVDELPISSLKQRYIKRHMGDYYYDSIFQAIQDNLKEINVNGEQIGNESEDTLKLVNSNGSGIYKFDSKYISKTLNISKSPLPDMPATDPPTDSDGKENKNIYLLKGRNIIILPVNSTVVIDGDLILAPNDNMPEDDKSNYPVLLVTGNLVINGSIKGIGTVFSMNSITINALPEPENDVDIKDDAEYDKYKKYLKNVEKNGAVIVHACNQLYITNTFSLLSKNDDAKDVTSSWILTQDRNALGRLDYEIINQESIISKFQNSDRECPQEFLTNSELHPLGTNTTVDLDDPLNAIPDDEDSKPAKGGNTPIPTGSQGQCGGGGGTSYGATR